MSQYKSAIRAQPPTEQPDSKYRTEARHLQELFPTWSTEDLQSLLVEYGGDVQLTATKISDGVAEPWDSVSRKKDKKNPTAGHTSKDSSRGDFRGVRGGRGGRGGAGRGGTATRGRGGARGGVVNGHSSHSGSPRTPSTAPLNGVTTSESTSRVVADAPATSELHEHQQNGLTSSTSTLTDSSSSQFNSLTPATSTSLTSLALGAASTTSTRGGDTDISESTSLVNAPVNKQASKIPATSKMSWAQIARSHEKPSPIPVPAPLTPAPSTPAPAACLIPSVPAPTTSVPEVETSTRGWEEPTTAQAPTWDDEPSKPAAASVPEAWPPATEPPSKPTSDALKVEPEPVPVRPKEGEDSTLAQEPLPENVKAEPVPQALPVQVAPPSIVQSTATPSPKLSARPTAAAHRTSARYKVTDQPVVMPNSFASIEKVGMQFGSLNLGSESVLESAPSEPEAPAVPEPLAPSTPQVKVHHDPAPPPATAPASSGSLSSVFQHQQSLVLPQSSVPQVSHHTIPTSISQPAQTPSVHTTAVAAASPIQQFAQQQQAASQQHSLASAHHQQQQQLHQQQQLQQQHLPQQLQQTHQHHSYSQHGLPTHIDPSQQIQSPSQQPHIQSTATHSNYFRQSEPASAAPYFQHTPTPPAGQAQDSYGSFGQISAQAQHQQASHLAGFGSGDYGYDTSRGFYESYAQQTGFGNRNVLGHDDVKSMTGTQQTSTSAGLPPSNAQASQQHTSSQGVGQPQPGAGQGPQQGYPPQHVPFYYPYPQNHQFYGTPYNTGYGVPQPAYMKYQPNVFQPGGPPGPGSAPSPATKQPGANVGVNVQPQSNPYSQGLYQQGGYDDYQSHPHHAQHQQHQPHQHSHTLGLSQAGGVSGNEYGKQLYGGPGQGFMGLSQGGAGSGTASNASGPRVAGSPETSYKSYAPKDAGLGVAAGRGSASQQGQGQGQPQGQGQQGGQGGPQGQGFYGGNRFGSGTGSGSVSGGIGGPQQTSHHQQGGNQGHLGYPQGTNEGNFYPYQQPRQQQQYWQ